MLESDGEEVESWAGLTNRPVKSLYSVFTTPMSWTPWSESGLSPRGLMLRRRRLLNRIWLVGLLAISVTSVAGKSPAESEEGSCWLFRESRSCACHFLSRTLQGEAATTDACNCRLQFFSIGQENIGFVYVCVHTDDLALYEMLDYHAWQHACTDTLYIYMHILYTHSICT